MSNPDLFLDFFCATMTIATKRVIYVFTFSPIVKPVLRGDLWNKEKMAFSDRWPLKRGSNHMKCFMTGQEKCDLLIQVTAWAGVTAFTFIFITFNNDKNNNN